LDGYTKNYEGHSKIRRLEFIAERCPDLQVQAFKMAVDELKRGCNSEYYTKVISRLREVLGDALGDEYNLDQKWVGIQNRRAIETSVQLEANIQKAKQESDRDRTRDAYEALAQHHMARGEWMPATTNFQYMKENSAPANTNAGDHQALSYCLQVINASVQSGSLSHVKNQATRALDLKSTKERPDIQSKLHAATGLYNLKVGQFSAAATAFLQCDISLHYPEVISPIDVTVYGSLCALACYSRRDLKNMLLGGSFKKFFELVPVWRQILDDFYNSRYGICLDALGRIEPDLRLDMYLAENSNLDKLISMIRDRALVNYFKPFTSIRIPAMAGAFHMDVAVMENLLAALIAEGKIAARIDSHNKVLLSRHADARSATYVTALAVGDRYLRDTRAMLLRMSLAQNEFSIRDPEAERRAKLRKNEDEDKRPEAAIAMQP
jgi:COP9 signalosome complex subunit 1